MKMLVQDQTLSVLQPSTGKPHHQAAGRKDCYEAHTGANLSHCLVKTSESIGPPQLNNLAFFLPIALSARAFHPPAPPP